MTDYYLYIARCRDESLYIGVSRDPTKRLERHNQGNGSSWIKQHGSAGIVYKEKYDNYLLARRRETQVKKWSRLKKENLIKGINP